MILGLSLIIEYIVEAIKNTQSIQLVIVIPIYVVYTYFPERISWDAYAENHKLAP